MSAHDRIQWFHKMVAGNCYPNSIHLAEKFDISHRQAQRDVDFLKTSLNAPLSYSKAKKGYFYESDFSLPIAFSNENDFEMNSLFGDGYADTQVIQMQLPYTATLEITDRITVMNIQRFIVGEETRHRYRCEFPSVELFLGMIISTGADIKIISPDWLRERLVESAEQILKNNKSIEE